MVEYESRFHCREVRKHWLLKDVIFFFWGGGVKLDVKTCKGMWQCKGENDIMAEKEGKRRHCFLA